MAVGAQGYQVGLGIHLSLVLKEGLDVVDLDVTLRVILAISLVEVEGAYRAGDSVILDRLPTVLLASLVGDVLDQTCWTRRLREDPSGPGPRPLDRLRGAYGTGAMQDAGYGLPRTPLLGTGVNKPLGLRKTHPIIDHPVDTPPRYAC